MNDAWYESKFTGIFRDFQRVILRPHDPQVSVYAGIAPHLHPEQVSELHVGGCGWSDDAAAGACVGEAVERLFAYPTDRDRAIECNFEAWALDEPAVEPERWILFHPDQYAANGFPFEPLTRRIQCRWVCFRDVPTGEPQWIPEEFAYLLPRVGCGHRFCPAISTGFAAGTAGQPLLLRALQEVIERDALLGAWWGKYPVEEFPQEMAWNADESLQLRRPNLRWRFFRIQSPFSRHVTMVSVEGDDWEGFVYSIGSACRESLRASWMKAALEAIQGRCYVRHLRPQRGINDLRCPLKTFSDHALYYSFHPQELSKTILGRCCAPLDGTESPDENLTLLCDRLGEKALPVLARNLTPPALVERGQDWRVVKVVVPGLQPLHGDDRFAHLGGKLWAPRSLKEWNETMPHPFP